MERDYSNPRQQCSDFVDGNNALSGPYFTQDLHRPNFEYPGLWYKIGDGQQELHINVRSDATLRRDKWIDRNDVHFALRVKSYRDTLAWLGGKDFREDIPDNDPKKLQLRPNSPAGYPQIYLLDPDRNIIEFHCEKLD